MKLLPAKGNKQNLSELALVLVAADRQDFCKKHVDRYKAEKGEI